MKKSRPLPDGFTQVAREMTRTQLKDYYRCGIKQLNYWAQLSGVVPPTRAAKAWNAQTAEHEKRRGHSARDIDRLIIAANTIRHYTAVFPCDERGVYSPAGSYWLVGTKIVTSDDLVDIAAMYAAKRNGETARSTHE